MRKICLGCEKWMSRKYIFFGPYICRNKKCLLKVDSIGAPKKRPSELKRLNIMESSEAVDRLINISMVSLEEYMKDPKFLDKYNIRKKE